jgi:hypothetical protein
MARIELKTGLTLAGGFVLGRSLGRGNGTEVWTARRAESPEGVEVAVKVLRDKGRYPRLCAQAAAMGRLFGTERIVRLVSSHLYDDPTFLAFEPVVHANLAERLAEGGPLGARAALEVLRDVLRALAEAHDRGVPHGDLKPANVLLDAGGRAVLTDFEGDFIPADDATPLPPALGGGPRKQATAGSDIVAAGALLDAMAPGEPAVAEMRARCYAAAGDEALGARAIAAEVDAALQRT